MNPSEEMLASYHYTLGLAGNRTRIDEHDGTSLHYDYDYLHRLTLDRVTDASGEQVYRRDFVYDPVGNRRTQTIDEGGGPTAITSTYDDRDRLLTAGATSYGWDDNGNLISRDGTSYIWDVENHLTSVMLGDGTVIATVYDADGNRVRTVVTPQEGVAATVEYLVDTAGVLSHVVADVNGGSVETLYTRASDRLIGLYRPVSGSRRYYHADGLGSQRVLSDATGAATDRYNFTAFGEILGNTGTDTQPYRFAGQPFSPDLGFYFNRARWLDTGTGRFLGMDPLPGRPNTPGTLQRYVYAANDPANLVDPTGLFTAHEVAITGVVISALATTAIGIALGTLYFRNKPVTVRLRPVLLRPTRWSMSNVINSLEGSQAILDRQGANVRLRWTYPEGLDVNSSEALSPTWEELNELGNRFRRSRTIPVFFVERLRDPNGTINPWLAGLAGLTGIPPNCTRGSRRIALAADFQQSPLFLAHEIGHAAGCLEGIAAGNLPNHRQFLMSKDKEHGDIGGSRLRKKEIELLHANAKKIR